MKKILITRFSSIGDIVLTTPVLRCLKQQLAGVEIHYVTKLIFAPLLVHNPYISRLHTFNEDVAEIYPQLLAETFDYVIDLHKNLRSLRLKRKLGVNSFSFNKLNFEKLLAVRLKSVKLLPPVHIVDRYLQTVTRLGVKNDNKGLDYFIGENDRVNVSSLWFNDLETKYTVLVVGGSYYTKKIPYNKLKEICTTHSLPLVLMGDGSDALVATRLQKEFPAVINACGRFSINQSASVIQQAQWVITSDTGLMHIASAFNKKIISVWGNTVPEFGMGPYKPQPENRILEIKKLSCRPCSKLGYKKCPKGHFKCMNNIDFSVMRELH